MRERDRQKDGDREKLKKKQRFSEKSQQKQ